MFGSHYPGVRSWILAQSHTFMEIDPGIDHEIHVFSTVILILLLIQRGLLSVTKESRQEANVQMSQPIHIDSPGPSLLAYIVCLFNVWFNP